MAEERKEELEISLTPLGREDIHKLEAALLVGTLFRKEVLDLIRDPSERLTWIDSLAVAAGALAREKAKMSVRDIAEDLGRSEAVIRGHLAGKTKAGELVRETYEKFVKEGVKPEFLLFTPEEAERLEEERRRAEKLSEALENLLADLRKALDRAEEALRSLRPSQ